MMKAILFTTNIHPETAVPQFAEYDCEVVALADPEKSEIYDVKTGKAKDTGKKADFHMKWEIIENTPADVIIFDVVRISNKMHEQWKLLFAEARRERPNELIVVITNIGMRQWETRIFREWNDQIIFIPGKNHSTVRNAFSILFQLRSLKAEFVGLYNKNVASNHRIGMKIPMQI